MFRRLLVENWEAALTIVSFAIFGAVFLAVLIRALTTPRAEVNHAARLPLENDHE